ncbi:MAG: hypothetical protein Q9166_001794 [cf. Caloplaca sp. 2 TL-2023]
MASDDGYFIRNDRDPADVSCITDLLMPTFSGTKDDFGKEVVPPRPLTFDRVSEGRPPVSEAKLLNLPTEILALVVESIPKESLVSFALVNSDCRQLARSRQFASVLLDYGNESWQIIQQLGREVNERTFGPTNGKTKNPALGPCIRRLTVATAPRWLAAQHGVALSEQFATLPEPERNQRLREACEDYFGVYLTTIEHLLLDRLTLPHLELLDWEDAVPLQPCFFDAVTNSSIKHFKACRVQLDRPTIIRPPSSQLSVHDELVSLDVDTYCNATIQDFFDHRGRVPGLQVFIWHTPRLGEKPESSLTFLQSNPQLSKLEMFTPTPAETLEERILPLLASSFSRLTSLSLTWDECDKDISNEALAMISTISTLEQLRLSAGEQFGWRHDWLVDHEKMRHHLSKLHSLKKVALTRDSYSNGIFLTCERYYEDGWFRIEDMGNDNYTRAMFEEEHRDRILQEAGRYVTVMPKLEWLYFGQIPMAVEQDSKSDKKVVKPLTAERDDCWTLLNEMFGWKGLLRS